MSRMPRGGTTCSGALALVLAIAGCEGSIGGPSGGGGTGATAASGAGGSAGPGVAGGGNAAGAAAAAGSSGGVLPNGAAVPLGMRRLTATEYAHTITALFGSGVTIPTALDPDDTTATFASVGAYRVATSPDGVQKYEDASYSIAQQIFASPALIQATVGCDPAQGDPCATSFVKGFGRRAWRRPLTDTEVTRYVQLIDAVGTTLGSPQQGFQYGLAGLLQSPNFLYVPEVGEVVGGALRFTSYEMASRLSYLVTEGPPDAELSAAADSNQLVTPAGVSAQLQRLLALPSVKPVLIGFMGQLLQLGQLDGLNKDATVYPEASPDLFAAMGQEASAMIEQNMLIKRGAMLDLFDARSTFSNPLLAKLYGAGQPERVGILTTAAWLSIQAQPTRTSPTFRGVFIREAILCQDVPSPPANVVTMLPPPAADAGTAEMTTRQILEAHRKNPTCAACHSFFDPIGVAFEHFDGIGAYRTTDNGQPVDPSGALDGQPFSDARGLMTLLKADPRVPDCMVKNLFHFVSGHDQLATEADVVGALAPGFRSSPDFLDLLTTMVDSAWFRTPAPPL